VVAVSRHAAATLLTAVLLVVAGCSAPTANPSPSAGSGTSTATPTERPSPTAGVSTTIATGSGLSTIERSRSWRGTRRSSVRSRFPANAGTWRSW